MSRRWTAQPVLDDLPTQLANMERRLGRRAWAPGGGIETYSRFGSRAAEAVGLTSGRLQLHGGLILPAGVPVSNLAFMSQSAAVTPTNTWFALVDQSGNVLGKTVNDAGTGTGDTTSGSPTITNLSNVASWKVGAGIAGTGIPAGAVVATVGASSLTMTAGQGGAALNATATAAGVTLTSAWVANAIKQLALSTAYTPTVDIATYLGAVCVAGTAPNLLAVASTSQVNAFAPPVALNTTTGLTDPASLASPVNMAAAVAVLGLAYGYVT